MNAYSIVPSTVAAVLDVETINKLKRRRIGSHQEAVFSGNSAWSLADLQGKARKYGVHYKDARDNLFRWLTDQLPAGVDLVVQVSARGKLSLCWKLAGMNLAQWARAAERPGLAGIVE